jgi:hypothetical protein
MPERLPQLPLWSVRLVVPGTVAPPQRVLVESQSEFFAKFQAEALHPGWVATSADREGRR